MERCLDLSSHPLLTFRLSKRTIKPDATDSSAVPIESLLDTFSEVSNVERYIQTRESENPNFRKELDEERRNPRIGILIGELRLKKGMTQEDLAQQVRTTKSAISRLENHAENMTIATLEKVAHALGKVVHIALS